MNATRHVLVTGGAGFIGSHLVEALVERGARVTVLDDLSSGSMANLEAVKDAPGFDFVLGDACAALGPQLGERVPTDIVHLAAQVSVVASVANPLRDNEQNLVATLRVIELARALGAKVAYASSAAVYGEGPLPSEEGLPLWPASPYGIHKLASEHHLRAAAAIDQLACRSLRFFNVYGPRQRPSSPYAGVISIFLSRALAGEPLMLFGGGVATRDFIYVKDVVAAIIGALDGEGDGGALNVGTGGATSVRALAETVLAVTGSASPLVDGPARAGEVLHSRAEVTRIASVLGWHARTDLAHGLAATAAWIAERAG